MTAITPSEKAQETPSSGRSGPRDRRPRASDGSKERSTRRSTIVLAQLALTVIILVVWQTAASNGWIDPFFISTPLRIGGRLLQWLQDGSVWLNLLPTLEEAAVGFIVSAVVGTGLGLLLARFTFLERVTRPFVDILNTLPRIALAPLFVLWFGLGFQAKVFLVVSVVALAFLINAYAGVTSVDTDFVRLAKSLGGSQRAVIVKIIIPSITPWLFAAVRFGVAYSLATAIVAEIVAANHGLGYLISYSSGVLDTTGVFAALVLVAIVAWIINTAIAYLERHLLRWQTAARRGGQVF